MFRLRMLIICPSKLVVFLLRLQTDAEFRSQVIYNLCCNVEARRGGRLQRAVIGQLLSAWSSMFVWSFKTADACWDVFLDASDGRDFDLLMFSVRPFSLAHLNFTSPRVLQLSALWFFLFVSVLQRWLLNCSPVSTRRRTSSRFCGFRSSRSVYYLCEELVLKRELRSI